jgi:hypothetical protein
VGVAPGIIVESDGTRWSAADGRQLLARSAVAVNVTGTTAETTVATVTVPAGLMGVDGGLEWKAMWSYPNSSNTKTARAKLGGTQLTSTALTTTAALTEHRTMRNRGSATSQLVSGGAPGSANTTALATTGVNTANQVDFTLTAQLSVTSETMTLAGYEVWLLR